MSYNPREPRNKDGEWTSGAAGSDHQHGGKTNPWTRHLQKGEDAAVLKRGPHGLVNETDKAMYRDALARSKANGNNAGGGNRAVASHVAKQHKVGSRVGALTKGAVAGGSLGTIAGAIIGAGVGAAAVATVPVLIPGAAVAGALAGGRAGGTAGAIIGGFNGLALRRKRSIAAQHERDTGKLLKKS